MSGRKSFPDVFQSGDSCECVVWRTVAGKHDMGYVPNGGLIGAWTGLVVGGLIGIRLFLKAWSGIKELKEAITDLQ